MPEALQPQQLLGALTRGHRAPAAFRLGLEYEMFVVRADGHAVPYAGPGGLAEILAFLADRTGWTRKTEGPHLLGLAGPDGRGITLEPGAQIEFNSSPRRTVGEIAEELEEMLAHYEAACHAFDVRFLGLGAQPADAPEDIVRLPKARYDVLEPYLAGAGDLGLWMMKTTCGTQVNFDHADAADAARKLATGLALAPVLSALFANSALRAGASSGYASWRGHVWTRTDPTRCGIPAALVRAETRLEDYVEWALDAPMLFRVTGGEAVDGRGRSFRQHLAAGEATLEEWELHLSTLFPEVRFRPQLEIRSTDTGCPDMALALAALVRGLFYDPRALAAAWELTAGWSHAERVVAWEAAHRHGLAAPLPGGGRMLDLARALLDLVALEPAEAAYLAPLHEILAQGASEGEQVAALADGAWADDPVGHAVRACYCLPRGPR
jgi:glutamate--cysteine ligase